MEHSSESHRLTGLHAEGHDVLDLEVDHFADADAVPQPFIIDFDRCTLNPKHLAYQRRQAGHWAAELPTEDLDELVELLVCRGVVDEHADAPVPLSHYFRRIRDQRDLPAADICVPGRPLSDLEHKSYPAEFVRRSVVEGRVARAHQLTRAGLDVIPS